MSQTGIASPLGTIDTFTTYGGQGNLLEAANTMGLPLYARQHLDEKVRWIDPFYAARFVSDTINVDVRVSGLFDPRRGDLIVIGTDSFAVQGKPGAQITGAGLGTWLGNRIRVAAFPKSGDSLTAAALVWSNAPMIIGAHDTGPLIRSKNGFRLAIPTPAAAKSVKGGRITPGEWERSTGLRLRYVYRRRGPSLLVVEGRRNSKERAFGRLTRPHSPRPDAGWRPC